MSTEGAGASRAGGSDFHNEDAFLVKAGLGLYVVCDGASGTPNGELASRTAVEAIDDFIEHAEEDHDFRGERVAREVVECAMGAAMEGLSELERSDPALAGLSTTVTMLLAHGRTGVIGHRGDSRAYLVRQGRARQLTVDDELTQEPEEGAEHALFEVFSLDLRAGDTLILCTDGAEDVVQDASIERAARNVPPHVLASRIVSAANRLAPDQDATAVVVRVRGEAEPGWLELSDPPARTKFGHTIPVSQAR